MTKKHDKQVIFTTHNPSILDGLNLDDEDQRLHLVFRNAEGNTVVKRHIRKKGLPGMEQARLSEAFIRGYLGRSVAGKIGQVKNIGLAGKQSFYMNKKSK
jgi:hypothetical protein